MKILIIGSGGRENIISEKLSKGNEIYCISSWINPDICTIAKDYGITEMNEDNIFQYCLNIKPDMVIVGSETLLNTDLVMKCNSNGFKCIAPEKPLAQLETSKVFSRHFLNENGFEDFNPKYHLLKDNNCNIKSILKNFDSFVIKLDGLAGGKGVFVQDDHFNTLDEGISIIEKNLKTSNILIEEKLMGDEFSLFTLCDGYTCVHFPPVQDYKRAYENNKGPNTGGMGSIMDDFDFLNKNDILTSEEINTTVLMKIQERYNIPYIGVLYGSFMKTYSGKLKVIEFNCRFGDSEVFNILNCVDDLSNIFTDMINNKLKPMKIKPKKSVVKYLVPQGYPNSSERKTIKYQKMDNVYSSSLDINNKLLGSRAIAVYGESENIYKAYKNCEKIINIINVDNLYWRKDIGNIDKYKIAGVDIDKGNQFVRLIKSDVESTYNTNVIGHHGNFGGQYRYNNNTLVASTDGVGTKSILVKKYTGDYYNCGHDIVNHSINDILVQGALPLFFLDYVASSKLNISDISSFVKGCCDACKKVNCVLLGGETAEMPSIYRDNHLDMVGTIVGEKKIEIHGVSENDIAIGLPSSGPQTNGYTLIRNIIEKCTPPQDILSQLIEPHSSFLNDVLEINKLHKISGMCHITGGGLTENLKRIIPNNLYLNLDNIEYPDWCKWLQRNGELTDSEMKKIFNCGIGYIVFIRPTNIIVKRSKKLRIGILGSTNGTILDYIINAINEQSSTVYENIEIALIISDKHDSGILRKGINNNIKNIHIPYIQGEGRDNYDNKITNEFEKENVDFILCIGWMRILSESFVKQWKQRCLNVHPSLLPKYSGGMDLSVHEEVLKNKETETGCTIHFVTDELDSGPIIIQKKCIIENDDTPEKLKIKVQKLEGDAYIEALTILQSNIIGKTSNNIYLGIIKNKY